MRRRERRRSRKIHEGGCRGEERGRVEGDMVKRVKEDLRKVEGRTKEREQKKVKKEKKT